MAESLYEAAILGLARLRNDQWAEPIAPGTQVEVRVCEPATAHYVGVAHLRRWADGVTPGPDDALKKRRLKALLA